MTQQILKGSCLCGGITYEIRAPLTEVINCHCPMCRKAHGAAFRTRTPVKAADFIFLSGEDLLTFYECSPGERRSFCKVCGANPPASNVTETVKRIAASCHARHALSITLSQGQGVIYFEPLVTGGETMNDLESLYCMAKQLCKELATTT